MIQSFGTQKKVAELKFPHPVSRVKHAFSTINRPSAKHRTQIPSNTDIVRIPRYIFRSFPPEIRLIIYGFALKWDGKTPALLAALRGDPYLYGEALQVFYAINDFRFSTRNDWLMDLPRSHHAIATTSKTVTSVTFEFMFLIYSSSSSGKHLPSQSCLNEDKLFKILPSFSLLSHLHIDFSSVWSIICPCNSMVWPFFTSQQPQFLIELKLSVGDCMVRRNQNQFLHLIETVNHGLGVSGRLDRVVSSGPQCWVWKAERKVLRWNEGLGYEGRRDALVLDLFEYTYESLRLEEDAVGPAVGIWHDDEDSVWVDEA